MKRFKAGQNPKSEHHCFLFFLSSLLVLLLIGFTVLSSPSLAQVVCGDGVVEGFEECDDGNTNDGDGCSAGCQIEACCQSPMGFACVQILVGDPDCPALGGTQIEGAICTDPVTGTCVGGGGVCGDGVVDTGEDCDDMGESATCDADSTAATCCDGTLNATAGEECDDGNLVDGDGCSMTCTAECDIQSLIDISEDLVFLGVPEAQGLKPKVKNAQTNLDQGDISGACDKLQAFINYVRAMIASGRLVPPTGQQMIEGAETCRTANGC